MPRKEKCRYAFQKTLLRSATKMGAISLFAHVYVQQPAPVMTDQLKPNVYWIEGGGGNSTVIVGDKGVIVVEPKTTAVGGKELLDDIAKIAPRSRLSEEAPGISVPASAK
jgi:hypothetical protein